MTRMIELSTWQTYFVAVNRCAIILIYIHIYILRELYMFISYLCIHWIYTNTLYIQHLPIYILQSNYIYLSLYIYTLMSTWTMINTQHVVHEHLFFPAYHPCLVYLNVHFTIKIIQPSKRIVGKMIPFRPMGISRLWDPTPWGLECKVGTFFWDVTVTPWEV